MNEFKDLKENNLIKNNFKQDNQNSYLKTPEISGMKIIFIVKNVMLIGL